MDLLALGVSLQARCAAATSLEELIFLEEFATNAS